MERFRFTPANTKEGLLAQKEEITSLHENAKQNNPECAGGGCGGKCGTVNCVKKMQGVLNQINKGLRAQEDGLEN